MKSSIYELRISSLNEGFNLTPENLPALALAEYIDTLVKLLGGKKYSSSFTFDGLKQGSAILALKSDEYDGEIEKKSNYLDKLNDSLNRNGHKAELKKDNKIIYLFDGQPENKYVEVFQEASFYGQVIKIGGKDETIPLALKDNEGNIVNLTIKDKNLAKEISKYYLGQEIECKGQGILRKGKDHKWFPAPNKFTISSFEVMEDISVSEWIAQLQALPSNWKKETDPNKVCAEIRGNDN